MIRLLHSQLFLVSILLPRSNFSPNDNNGRAFQQWQSSAISFASKKDFGRSLHSLSASSDREKFEITGTNASTSSVAGASEAVGLGGRSGIRPDVNSLKRNLVQEAVRAYKSEFLDLLGNPAASGSASSIASAAASSASAASTDGAGFSYRASIDTMPVSYYKYGPGAALSGRTYSGEWATRDELIEDKLAALVQANPVSTTTDSNLLEGQWTHVFTSHKASDIVDPSRFVFVRSTGDESSTKPAAGAIKSGVAENPVRSLYRRIHLEELDPDEVPYIVDTKTYFGGLWSISSQYDVTGLSRTAIDLGLKSQKLCLLGIRVPMKRKKGALRSKMGATLANERSYIGSGQVQILYLDSDLCITTTEKGLDGPMLVYTKSKFWTTGRKGKFLANWLWSQQSPLRIRRKLIRLSPFNPSRRFAHSNGLGELRVPAKYTESENSVLLQRDYSDSDRSRLLVLKMGESIINPDGTLREDLSWDGPSDPFVHLDAQERQRVLKKMTIKDIEAEGKAQKEANRKKTNKDKYWKKKRTFKRISEN